MKKKQLQKNVKSRNTSIRLLGRSKLVLLAAKHIPNCKIAKELEVNVNKVARYRNRFLERRIQGLEKDLSRGANHGAKNSVEQAKLRSKVIKITTQEKPENSTHSSTRSLAKNST